MEGIGMSAEHSHVGHDGFQVRCPRCGGEVSPTSWRDPRMACDGCGEVLPCCETMHEPVSVSGWTCDLCGESVNGQTDEDGRPLHDGESVRHVGPAS
jgi:hypothetical protein